MKSGKYSEIILKFFECKYYCSRRGLVKQFLRKKDTRNPDKIFYINISF